MGYGFESALARADAIAPLPGRPHDSQDCDASRGRGWLSGDRPRPSRRWVRDSGGGVSSRGDLRPCSLMTQWRPGTRSGQEESRQGGSARGWWSPPFRPAAWSPRRREPQRTDSSRYRACLRDSRDGDARAIALAGARKSIGNWPRLGRCRVTGARMP